MNTDSAKELKACPFCGEAPLPTGQEETGLYYRCQTKDCYLYAKFVEPSAWNRRAPAVEAECQHDAQVGQTSCEACVAPEKPSAEVEKALSWFSDSPCVFGHQVFTRGCDDCSGIVLAAELRRCYKLLEGRK